MKYAIVIPDGCADEPQESLGGKTPLQAAHTPNMDRIAAAGVVGRANNVPPSLTPASDVATLSLFGYDPLAVYTGRAPLETAAMGIHLGPADWAIRCNLVHVADECMRDFTAGHITSEDGRQLMEAMQAAFGGPASRFVPGLPGRLEFYPGVSYRNILVYRGEPGSAPFAATTKTQPPHDVPDQPIANHLPAGPGSDLLRAVMEQSRAVFATHPVNHARTAAGKKPATQVWLWGQGRSADHPAIRRGLRQAWARHPRRRRPGSRRRRAARLGPHRRTRARPATSTPTTPPRAATVYSAGRSRPGVRPRRAPDEASHEGRADEKVKRAGADRRTHRRPAAGGAAEARRSAHPRLARPPHHPADAGRTPTRRAVRDRRHRHPPRGQWTYDEATAAASDLTFEKDTT
ncbi:MAG: phosphoglycerate mutase [Gemmataceae bacterium]